MIRRLCSVLLGLVLVAGSVAPASAEQIVPAAPAPAAAAGPLCTFTAGVVCGRITNATNMGIGIIPNWGPDWQNGYGGGGWQTILWPGENSSKYYQDTDGIFTGQCYMVDVQVLARYGWVTVARVAGPKNYKIRDANVYRAANARRFC